MSVCSSVRLPVCLFVWLVVCAAAEWESNSLPSLWQPTKYRLVSAAYQMSQHSSYELPVIGCFLWATFCRQNVFLFVCLYFVGFFSFLFLVLYFSLFLMVFRFLIVRQSELFCHESSKFGFLSFYLCIHVYKLNKITNIIICLSVYIYSNYHQLQKRINKHRYFFLSLYSGGI